MLKIEIDKGIHIEAAGTGLDIISEMCAAIHEIHALQNAQNPLHAAIFRDALTHAISDPDSPIWDGKALSNSTMICIPPNKKTDDADHHD